ncbi:MAG: ABC transporter substrate-binding protein [Acidobacteria bacterium]|nr:MAG: ABC transporter substrate-binding protein [Acidobacteriota bacterium]
MLEARGVEVVRQYELAGNVPHESLINGQIDCYPEYTGTSYMAILKHPLNTDARAVYETIKRDYALNFKVEVSPPLGYENTFAILVRGEDARRLGLKTISDAVPHARNWRAGFGQDFMSRADGYPGFSRTYNLQFAAQPREMDLSLTYRALADHQVDMIAGNSTDGLISALDLFQLEDDLHYFPPYEAVILVRKDALARVPEASNVLSLLGGKLTTEEMRRLNYEVDGKHRDKRDVAREWIEKAVTSDK